MRTHVVQEPLNPKPPQTPPPPAAATPTPRRLPPARARRFRTGNLTALVLPVARTSGGPQLRGAPSQARGRGDRTSAVRVGPRRPPRQVSQPLPRGGGEKGTHRLRLDRQASRSKCGERPLRRPDAKKSEDEARTARGAKLQDDLFPSAGRTRFPSPQTPRPPASGHRGAGPAGGPEPPPLHGPRPHRAARKPGPARPHRRPCAKGWQSVDSAPVQADGRRAEPFRGRPRGPTTAPALCAAPARSAGCRPRRPASPQGRNTGSARDLKSECGRRPSPPAPAPARAPPLARRAHPARPASPPPQLSAALAAPAGPGSAALSKKPRPQAFSSGALPKPPIPGLPGAPAEPGTRRVGGAGLRSRSIHYCLRSGQVI
ncbi:basic salivary proline-rich protein 2-like [Myotis daubentonii]|uniref:basic salivary proline-rich protein 2-like n=1 Tax=Myotis daubentonii TaxID=98922 RepID=UPI00287348CC|nr:basic salivary proline-rich protein 2-like [Myotis daubentonii]